MKQLFRALLSLLLILSLAPGSEAQPQARRAFFMHQGSSGAATVYDTDASAFFTRHTTAGGALTNTQKEAINNFVLALKSAGVYSKITEMWLFVGGTAATHALGFKNAYNVTWVGSPTHAANGVDFNGTTQYGNTGLVPNAAGWTNQNLHISVYCVENGTSIDANECFFGSHPFNNSSFRISSAMQNGGLWAAVDITQSGVRAGFNLTDTRGFFLGTRSASTLVKLWYNGASTATRTDVNAGALPAYPLYFGAASGTSGPLYFSNKALSFGSVGTGLTDAEAQAFTTAVNTLQSYLGRSTYSY